MAILAVHVKVSEAAAFLTKNKTLQLIWDQFSWQLTTILWAAHFKLRLIKSILMTPRGSNSPVYAHFGRTHQKLKTQTYGCLANCRNFNSNVYNQFLQQLTMILWAAHIKMRLVFHCPHEEGHHGSITEPPSPSHLNRAASNQLKLVLNNSQRFQNYLNSWALLASAGHLRWFQSLARSRWRLPLILCWTLLVPIVVSDARNVRTNARALTISLVHYQ